VKLYCSLDAPMHIFNVYPRRNSQTLYSLLNNFFPFVSSFKYHLTLCDLNACHIAWEDSRCDTQGELIIRVCDVYQLSSMTHLLLFLHHPG